MTSAVRSILHPTDFSDASMDAFVHGLKLALAAKAGFHILHIRSKSDETAGNSAPRVRQTLAQWGLMDANDPPASVETRLGIRASKVELPPQNPVTGILAYLETHPSDLIVLATHGREGLPRWLFGSVAETVARKASIAALFVAPGAFGFVDPLRGTMRLQRILIPVDANPNPKAAIAYVRQFAALQTEGTAELRFLHAGRAAPVFSGGDGGVAAADIALAHGDPVEAIVREAEEWRADLIAMPTAGHHGLMDAINGSTTEQVLRTAPCPVLAIPAKG